MMTCVLIFVAVYIGGGCYTLRRYRQDLRWTWHIDGGTGVAAMVIVTLLVWWYLLLYEDLG